jgi:hypothetical protein
MDRGDGRRWLARLLATAAVCAIIAAVSGILQGVLSATGDADGASAVRGVLLVAVTGVALCLAALLVLLAVIELKREPPRSDQP